MMHGFDFKATAADLKDLAAFASNKWENYTNLAEKLFPRTSRIAAKVEADDS
jgi:hypothetical protein